EQTLKAGRECNPVPFNPSLQLFRQPTEKQGRDRKKNSSKKMNSQALSPTDAFKTEPGRKPENERRENRPFIPIAQSPIKRLCPTNRTSESGARKVHLGSKEQAQKAGNGPDRGSSSPPLLLERRSAHYCKG